MARPGSLLVLVIVSTLAPVILTTDAGDDLPPLPAQLLRFTDHQSASDAVVPTRRLTAAERRSILKLFVKILRNLEVDVDDDLVPRQRKRTCRLDLGGHCATENAVAVADNWHYLNSHLSPGRRKRHAQPRVPRHRKTGQSV